MTEEHFEKGKIELIELRIRIITTDIPILGMFLNEDCEEEEPDSEDDFGGNDPCILAVLESPDNQLDFNLLQLKGEDDFLFNQHREIIPRKSFLNDPIEKFIIRFVEK